MSIVETYANDIHKNLRLYTNWPVNSPIALGDFGTVEGNLFQRMSSLKKHFNIEINTTRGPAQAASYSYRSGDAVTVTLKPRVTGQVGVADAKASMEVSFSRKNAIFLEADKCVVEFVDDEVALGQQLMQLLTEKRWDADWHIVTRLIRAESSTVIISSDQGANIKLEAGAAVPSIDLADANLELDVVDEKGIGYKAIAAKSMFPLIGLSRIRPRWLRRAKYVQLNIRGTDDNSPPTVEELVESLEGEPLDQALAFDAVVDDETTTAKAPKP